MLRQEGTGIIIDLEEDSNMQIGTTQKAELGRPFSLREEDCTLIQIYIDCQ